MEERVYTCLKSEFSELEKKIRRIIKKLEKKGLEYKFEIVKEEIREIPVYNGYEKLKPIPMEVVDYIFYMEEYKLGNYVLVGVLDHTTDEKENMVYYINKDIEIPRKYYTSVSHCDHCNTDRKRNKTVILYSEKDGSYLQVGTDCLKDFIGIKAFDIVRGHTDLQCLDLQDMEGFCLRDYDMGLIKPLYKVKDYLASCIREIEEYGYNKMETKYKAIDKIHDKVDSDTMDKANKVLEYFSKLDIDELSDFMRNTKIQLSQEYIKGSNGFIAYSYLAHEKEMEKEKERELKRELNIMNTVNGYYGEVGKRYELELLCHGKIASCDTLYGTMYIIKYTDKDGHTFIYKGGTPFGETGKSYIVKGTIKGHNVFNGENQTVISRCKVVKEV